MGALNLSSEARLAWLAGIIDGEGSICLSKRRVKKVTPKREYRYQPVLRISSTSEEFIIAINSELGSTSIFQRKAAGNRRKQFCIDVNSSYLRKLLPDLLPYLIVKRKQAKLLLQALRLTKENGKITTFVNKGKHLGSTKMLDENFSKLYSIYLKMKALNRRGR